MNSLYFALKKKEAFRIIRFFDPEVFYLVLIT